MCVERVLYVLVEKSYDSGGSRVVKAIFDPLFVGNYDPNALKQVIKIARLSIKPSRDSRSNILEVVSVLRKAQVLELRKKNCGFVSCKRLEILALYDGIICIILK